jgi:hypothetical protein
MIRADFGHSEHRVLVMMAFWGKVSEVSEIRTPLHQSCRRFINGNATTKPYTTLVYTFGTGLRKDDTLRPYWIQNRFAAWSMADFKFLQWKSPIELVKHSAR